MRFVETRWSMVLSAGDPTSQAYQESLAELCQVYWYPLYAYLRRRGSSADAAEDTMQGFFTMMLEQNTAGKAEESRGKFRTFMLTALKNFVANEYDRDQALKRGGDQPTLSLDVVDAEGRYTLEPSHDLTPDKLFDRSWALAILDTVMVKLETEWAGNGKKDTFGRLRHCLIGKDPGTTYRQIGEALGIAEGAVKVAVYRLRKRYGQLLREEIAETVSEDLDVGEELQHLLTALSP